MITLNNLRYHKVSSLVDVVKILKILPYMGMAAICCRNSFNIFCQRVKNGLHIIIFCDYQSKFDLAAKKSRINQRSPFGHTWQYSSSRSYIQSLKAKMIFKGLNHIWAVRPYCLQNVSPYYRSTHPLDTPYRIVQVVSDEMSFKNGDKLRRMTPDNYGRRQTTQPASPRSFP